LWARFCEIYGHQWASQQGDEPNDTWIKGLADITPEQYTAGLQALLTRTETWPPNLIEFRQLCVGHDPNGWRRRAHRLIDPATLLDDKTTKERRREENLEQIKKLREEAGL